MTNDTSGRTSPKQFAEYDPESSSWKTWPAIGLWGSVTYSESWPKTGMTRGGRAYELPTPEHPTAANGFSSLLPTPDTGVSPNGHGRRGGSARNGHQSGACLDVIATLLPTPTRRGHKGHNQRRDTSCLPGALLPTPLSSMRDGDSETIGDALSGRRKAGGESLLPTPSAADGMGGHLNRSGARSGELLLPGVAVSIGASTRQPSDAGNGDSAA